MNTKTKRTFILPAICSIALYVLASPVMATCSHNEQKIQATKVEKKSWVTMNNQYSNPKQVIFFHDDKGGLIKVEAKYTNPPHHYAADIAVVIVEGDFHITADGNTTNYSKGDYITIPANTCFNSFSNKGAMLVLLGAKPGESIKNDSETVD